MKIQQQVYQVLLKSDGFLSGEAMAQEFNVSRTAIWKAIHSLQQDGHEIESRRKEGYRLVSKSLDFNVNSIRDFLNESIDSDIHVMDCVDSTNTLAKKLADANAQEWTLVLAKQQTAGRGRFERSFYSPVGGMYFSFILRPHYNLSAIHLVTMNAAVAVCDAIAECLHVEVGIKWVNDIFLKGKKVGGILTEASIDAESRSFRYLVVGIGLNLKCDEIPNELKSIMCDLGINESFDKNRLVATIVNNFYTNLTESTTSLADKYRQRSIVINQEVYINNSDTPCGIVQTINDLGELVILTPDHQYCHLNSGEVSIRGFSNEPND